MKWFKIDGHGLPIWKLKTTFVRLSKGANKSKVANFLRMLILLLHPVKVQGVSFWWENKETVKKSWLLYILYLLILDPQMGVYISISL